MSAPNLFSFSKGLALLKSNRALAALLIVFAALAIFYSLIVPLFEGPDEDDHFRYAKFIADQRALPAQLFEPGGGVAGHQGWQPPLYYSLVAALIAPIDTSDYAQHLWRNAAATFVGDPSCCGRNLYYHTDSEDFPFTRTTLAVHLARLLSIFFGVITVAATYELTKTIIESVSNELRITNYELRISLALASAVVVAFNPSFLFASALVTNDAPLAAFSALVLLMWVKLLCEKITLDTKSSVLLGALIGLGLLSKTTALGLIPLTMFVLVFVAWRKRAWRLALTTNAVMLAVIALTTGWWFTRNQMLYGDPLALKLVSVSALFPRAGDLTPAELAQISLPWLWQTFWGGPTPGDFSPIILAALAILTALAVIGFTRFAIRDSQFAIRISLFFLAAWLAFILLAQIQFIRTTTGADQGRYLFPAISAFALFFVIGLRKVTYHVSRIGSLAHWRIGSLSHWLIGSLFLLALFVPFAYTLPAYARPALASANDLARATNPLAINFADRIELRGYDLDARAVKPGESLRVTLYWRARAPMRESYRVFAHLIGQGDRTAGGVDVIPGRGAFPTVYWKAGDALRDVVIVSVAPNALPGKYAIEVGLYPVGKPSERLTAFETGEDRALIGAVKVAPREASAFAPRARVAANFADVIELEGYDIRVTQDEIRLSLAWRARARVNRDYTVFVHALDANGAIIAQADQQPQTGNYPTSIWDVGEQIRDDYVLRAPTRPQRILVGLYRADTGARLPVQGTGSTGDRVEIVIPGGTP